VLEDGVFLQRVVDLLARYFIRRNVTDKPPTRQIDQALIDVVDHAPRDSDRANGWNSMVRRRVGEARSARLPRRVPGGLGGTSTTTTRRWLGILIQLDQLHHSREYQPDFWP